MIEKINWIIWLGLVIMWNYGFPQASPFEDVQVTRLTAELETSNKSFAELTYEHHRLQTERAIVVTEKNLKIDFEASFKNLLDEKKQREFIENLRQFAKLQP